MLLLLLMPFLLPPLPAVLNLCAELRLQVWQLILLYWNWIVEHYFRCRWYTNYTQVYKSIIGLSGNTYTLQWTISNGFLYLCQYYNRLFCYSTNCSIASANQSFCISATVANLVATPPSGVVNWFSASSEVLHCLQLLLWFW